MNNAAADDLIYFASVQVYLQGKLFQVALLGQRVCAFVILMDTQAGRRSLDSFSFRSPHRPELVLAAG